MMLGNMLESALSAVGITKERVEKFLGKPCNCAERKEKLNQLGNWARRVLTGKPDKAKEHLEGIIEEEEMK